MIKDIQGISLERANHDLPAFLFILPFSCIFASLFVPLSLLIMRISVVKLVLILRYNESKVFFYCCRWGTCFGFL